MFAEFGKVSYTNETKVKDFVKFLKEGKIMATQCKICKKVYFPPRMDCNVCLTSDEMEWKEVDELWEIVTFTVSHFGPTGFEDDVPYTLAIAKSDSGLKVFARVSKDAKDIRVGMKCKLKPVTLPNNKVAYELVPVEV